MATVTVSVNEQEGLELHNQSFEDFGFIAAPLYYEFVKWAEPRVKHPVYGSMRGATPILTAAHQLAENGITDTADWSELWINRMVAQDINEPIFDFEHNKVMDYLAQEGIEKDKPFTLVDSGYKGTITKSFNKKGFQPQTLFVVNHLKNPLSHEQLGFLNDSGYRGEKHKYLSVASIMEQVPPLCSQYEGLLRTENGIKPMTYKLSKQQSMESQRFYSGMKNGIEMCVDSDKKHRKQRLFSYLDVLYNNTFDLSDCRNEVRRVYE